MNNKYKEYKAKYEALQEEAKRVYDAISDSMKLLGDFSQKAVWLGCDIVEDDDLWETNDHGIASMREPLWGGRQPLFNRKATQALVDEVGDIPVFRIYHALNALMETPFDNPDLKETPVR